MSKLNSRLLWFCFASCWTSYIVYNFTAVKRKTYLTSGLSEPSSLNQFTSLRARSSCEIDAEHVQISLRQNLCITFTSFPTHTQRKKLTFSETVLSFRFKRNFRDLSVFSFVNVWRELRTRRAFDRCVVYNYHYAVQTFYMRGTGH